MPQRKYDLHGISNPGHKDTLVNRRILEFDRSPSGRALIGLQMALAVLMAVLFFLSPLVNKTVPSWYVVFYVLSPIYLGVGVLRMSLGSKHWLLPRMVRDKDEKFRSPEDEDYVQTEVVANLAYDRYGRMAKEMRQAKEEREVAESEDVSKSEVDDVTEDSTARKWPPELEESDTKTLKSGGEESSK